MNNNDDILKLLETIAKNYIKLNNNLNIELVSFRINENR